MKLLITSDLHLGSYEQFDQNDSRLERGLTALKIIYNTAAERNCKLIIDCGDLIDRKNMINFKTYNRIYETFQNYATKPFYSLVGNHNLSSLTTNNLIPLSEFITIFNKPTWKIIDDIALCLIPYCRELGDWETALTSLCSDSPSPATTINKRLLFSHQEVKGAKTGTHLYVAGEGLKLDSPLLNMFDYCIFGHYHKFQTLDEHGRFFYCGATIQNNFGEVGNTQGFWIYDTDMNTWEWVHLDLPEFKITADFSDIPENPKDFWRLYTPDRKLLPPELHPNIDVEEYGMAEQQDRLDIGPSFDFNKAVDAYLKEKIDPEHHAGIWSILQEIYERKIK